MQVKANDAGDHEIHRVAARKFRDKLALAGWLFEEFAL